MRRLAGIIRLLGWSLIVGVGALAIARALAWDAPSPLLVGAHGLGPLPYLAAFPVAAVALTRRHLRLGLVALAVGSAALPTGLPELTARTAVPAAARTAPRFRVLSWNLYRLNPGADTIDRIIRDADADVVVLQELSTLNLGAVRSSPALSAYAHTFISPMASAFGSGIWSRLPLDDPGELDLDGFAMTRAIVRSPAGAVRLINVHVLSPVAEGSHAIWDRQHRLLGEEARRPGPPVLLAGDFNATWGHRPFRRLIASGLSDAAAARGQWWAPTWPADRRFLPPSLRIDHVLTGPGLVATSYRTGPAGGSDHRSIVAEVAVTPGRS